MAADEEKGILFPGRYEMIGSEEDFGASLNIYQSTTGEVLIEGTAYYGYNIGEVSGLAQIADNSHFYYQEDGSRLDVAYDSETDQLTVEESGGSFGGLNVTFSGNYAKAGNDVSDTSG